VPIKYQTTFYCLDKEGKDYISYEKYTAWMQEIDKVYPKGDLNDFFGSSQKKYLFIIGSISII
jgi:hypothetical protein